MTPPHDTYDVLVPPANLCAYRQIYIVGNGSGRMLASQSGQDHFVELSGADFPPLIWYVMVCEYTAQYTTILYIYLVGGLEHFLFFHILGIIIPTDFHVFQRD